MGRGAAQHGAQYDDGVHLHTARGASLSPSCHHCSGQPQRSAHGRCDRSPLETPGAEEGTCAHKAMGPCVCVSEAPCGAERTSAVRPSHALACVRVVICPPRALDGRRTPLNCALRGGMQVLIPVGSISDSAFAEYAQIMVRSRLTASVPVDPSYPSPCPTPQLD